MRIFNTQVFGFAPALRAMRNPMDSWDRADSRFAISDYYTQRSFGFPTDAPLSIGPNDMKLLQGLNTAGSEHRKAIRMIQVWATMEMPRYVLTELDTYKIAITRMSCSTMHKLGTKSLDVSDFANGEVLPSVLETLNELGRLYRQTKDYDFVRSMKRILPEGFLQRTDMNFNYETAKNIFQQRRNHRLEEWRYTGGDSSICDWIAKLPYMDKLVEL
jgi:hypothetical protein